MSEPIFVGGNKKNKISMTSAELAEKLEKVKRAWTK